MVIIICFFAICLEYSYKMLLICFRDCKIVLMITAVVAIAITMVVAIMIAIIMEDKASLGWLHQR